MTHSCILTDLTDPQIEHIVRIIGTQPFIEVGCGGGYYAELFQKLTGVKAFAIDAHPENLWDPASLVEFKYAYFDDWVIARKKTWKECQTVLLFYPSVCSTVGKEVVESLLPNQTLILIAPRPYKCERFAGTDHMWLMLVNTLTCREKVSINGIDFMYVMSYGYDASTRNIILEGHEIFEKGSDPEIQNLIRGFDDAYCDDDPYLTKNDENIVFQAD